MTPKNVRYVTKLVSVSAVTLEGTVSYRDDVFGGWAVGTDSLEEWLEKFSGRVVRLTIEVLGEPDEGHLLPEEEP